MYRQLHSFAGDVLPLVRLNPKLNLLYGRVHLQFRSIAIHSNNMINDIEYDDRNNNKIEKEEILERPYRCACIWSTISVC